MPLTGSISEWNHERGFGYLTCDSRRIFLHIRDFKERYKQPEVGDVVTFVLGADKQGRSCAKEAVHANTCGRLKVIHLLIFVFLILPGMAVYRILGQTAALYVGVWIVGISGITYHTYAADKRWAQENDWRQPESHLHLLEFLGGWPGAFFAQRRLRHKSSKGSYLFVFVLIIGLHQFLAIDALLGWPFTKLLLHAVKEI